MKFNKVQYFFHRLHLFCWSFTSHFKICHQNSTPTRNNIFLEYVSVCKMEDGQMSERFFRSKRPGYPHPVSSELENSGIRVAVSDCSVTEHRRWRPPYQTSKTLHVHAKHYKHNEDGRTALGVCGNGSVPLSHSGNAVTRIGIHTHSHGGRTHGAGCVRQWFRTAEPLGERRCENWNIHTK